ncbi:MAG: hypothetical protein PHO07_16820 [Pirellulales bacterium]|jgi:hypothetical protein|nr:hypothetical protein [Thermoguttaceae bacterium]MDD4788836.1 hypothetical protein [Pirellulales bacterium]MDI9443850.1 phosphatidylglycerophosphate synthase [Planctomycetota bacterium]NLY99458.1 CDP-alcohol phosphatidyltransferase family protein [Pirellulaceae bacterium]
MKRMPLVDLEQRCQKPDHRRIGNWMARRLVRPAALRVTWLVSPWGVSAGAATLAAWACGAAAAGALAAGSVAGWACGAALLQAWYLLDHVDGQLARLRGTASLDGVELDYLMHHTINLLVPLGAGAGLAAAGGNSIWAFAGAVWAISLVLLSARHDARYKAFVQRLKRVRGRLEVRGGGGGRPEPQPPMPDDWLRRAAWLARKSTEMHVVMNAVTGVALLGIVAESVFLPAARACVGTAVPLAFFTALWTIARSQARQAAEAEFAAWYRVPRGKNLVFRDGWWLVEEDNSEKPARSGNCRREQSS